MEKEEIFKKLQEIIADHLAVDNASEEDTIKGLGGDSLDSVDIISSIEKMFGIRISDEDAASMDGMNLGEIADEVIKRQELKKAETETKAEMNEQPSDGE